MDDVIIFITCLVILDSVYDVKEIIKEFAKGLLTFTSKLVKIIE